MICLVPSLYSSGDITLLLTRFHCPSLVAGPIQFPKAMGGESMGESVGGAREVRVYCIPLCSSGVGAGGRATPYCLIFCFY